MVKWIRTALCGAAAGAVTGLLGAGGGMVLLPLLSALTDIKEDALFPASIAVMLPVCAVALLISGELPWSDAAPWLAGSTLGGIVAGLLGKKIPVQWLHRGLGLVILWGGWRNLVC